MAEPDPIHLVDRIYDAAFEPEAWPGLLTEIAFAVGGVGGVIVPTSGVDGMAVICSPGLEEGNAAYERFWWRHDIRVQEFRRKGPAQAIVSDADFLPEERMRRDPFYQDFLRPQGLGHFLAHVASPGQGRAHALSFQRDIRKGAFERQDRTNLALLGPHVARSIEVSARLRQAARIRHEMAAVVDQIACGAIILDARGNVTFVNKAAQRLMGPAFTVRRGRLACLRTADQRGLDALIASALPTSSTLPQPSVAVARPDEALPILVQAVPIKPATADRLEQMTLGSGGVLLLVHDLAIPAGAALAHRLTHLGLTAGQARIAEAVGSGKSPRLVAETLGLSEQTVRHVLKTVYDKLDISRQSELAIIVAKLSLVR